MTPSTPDTRSAVLRYLLGALAEERHDRGVSRTAAAARMGTSDAAVVAWRRGAWIRGSRPSNASPMPSGLRLEWHLGEARPSAGEDKAPGAQPAEEA